MISFLELLGCVCCVLIMYLLDKIIEAENMKYHVKRLNKIVEDRVSNNKNKALSDNDNESPNAPYITIKDLREQMKDIYLINFKGLVCLLFKGLALFLTIILVR